MRKSESNTFYSLPFFLGFPGGSEVKKKKIRLPSRRYEFNPWVRKIPLEKEMATHFNILVWEIPWTEEHGGLQSMGSQRVGRYLATETTTATFLPHRKF